MCVIFFQLVALPEKSTGYVQVFLDGGLNQQRMGVNILCLDASCLYYSVTKVAIFVLH